MAPPAADMQQLKNTLKPSKNLCDIWLQVVLFFAVFGQPTSQSIVETLSAFSGTLPFKLETGYVSVGETNDVEIFYYVVESEPTLRETLFFFGSPEALVVLVYPD
ncbi:hypothetical protein CK203_046286 [Vitis vinifera]|uniref:Uncharacterized protein n=1 Tax=Vitis vinifera TaxID=29760 RepID=A0A438HDI2_VITVI|nr:hypothetical protein CK203_046286 [Vitis vinifera]